MPDDVVAVVCGLGARGSAGSDQPPVRSSRRTADAQPTRSRRAAGAQQRVEGRGGSGRFVVPSGHLLRLVFLALFRLLRVVGGVVSSYPVLYVFRLSAAAVLPKVVFIRYR